eukprot:GDKJ01037172.1.p1 GENE.GDKJ01037172.1~~GDKJ01037172.1.p1  ORF type:complete len:1128 (-),score=196.39 GDKJ01037172.1:212-3595(-)
MNWYHPLEDYCVESLFDFSVNIDAQLISGQSPFNSCIDDYLTVYVKELHERSLLIKNTSELDCMRIFYSISDFPFIDLNLVQHQHNIVTELKKYPEYFQFTGKKPFLADSLLSSPFASFLTDGGQEEELKEMLESVCRKPSSGMHASNINIITQRAEDLYIFIKRSAVSTAVKSWSETASVSREQVLSNFQILTELIENAELSVKFKNIFVDSLPSFFSIKQSVHECKETMSKITGKSPDLRDPLTFTDEESLKVYQSLLPKLFLTRSCEIFSKDFVTNLIKTLPFRFYNELRAFLLKSLDGIPSCSFAKVYEASVSLVQKVIFDLNTDSILRTSPIIRLAQQVLQDANLDLVDALEVCQYSSREDAKSLNFVSRLHPNFNNFQEISQNFNLALRELILPEYDLKQMKFNFKESIIWELQFSETCKKWLQSFQLNVIVPMATNMQYEAYFPSVESETLHKLSLCIKSTIADEFERFNLLYRQLERVIGKHSLKSSTFDVDPSNGFSFYPSSKEGFDINQKMSESLRDVLRSNLGFEMNVEDFRLQYDFLESSSSETGDKDFELKIIDALNSAGDISYPQMNLTPLIKLIDFVVPMKLKIHPLIRSKMLNFWLGNHKETLDSIFTIGRLSSSISLTLNWKANELNQIQQSFNNHNIFGHLSELYGNDVTVLNAIILSDAFQLESTEWKATLVAFHDSLTKIKNHFDQYHNAHGYAIYYQLAVVMEEEFSYIKPNNLVVTFFPLTKSSNTRLIIPQRTQEMSERLSLNDALVRKILNFKHVEKEETTNPEKKFVFEMPGLFSEEPKDETPKRVYDLLPSYKAGKNDIALRLTDFYNRIGVNLFLVDFFPIIIKKHLCGWFQLLSRDEYVKPIHSVVGERETKFDFQIHASKIFKEFEIVKEDVMDCLQDVRQTFSQKVADSSLLEAKVFAVCFVRVAPTVSNFFIKLVNFADIVSKFAFLRRRIPSLIEVAHSGSEMYVSPITTSDVEVGYTSSLTLIRVVRPLLASYFSELLDDRFILDESEDRKKNDEQEEDEHEKPGGNNQDEHPNPEEESSPMNKLTTILVILFSLAFLVGIIIFGHRKWKKRKTKNVTTLFKQKKTTRARVKKYKPTTTLPSIKAVAKISKGKV